MEDGGALGIEGGTFGLPKFPLLLVMRIESRIPGRLPFSCGGGGGSWNSGAVFGCCGCVVISGIAWDECARKDSAVSQT